MDAEIQFILFWVISANALEKLWFIFFTTAFLYTEFSVLTNMKQMIKWSKEKKGSGNQIKENKPVELQWTALEEVTHELWK